MPRLTNANPSYRRHKISGQAVVTLSGHDYYLGLYGSKVSRLEYDRVVGEWIVNGRRSPAAAPVVPDLTIVEMTVAYLQHAATYYRDADGNPTSELSALRLPMGVLVRLYGRTPAAACGPLAMEAVRNEMIAKGWGRRSINSHVGRLRRMFKWAVAKGAAAGHRAPGPGRARPSPAVGRRRAGPELWKIRWSKVGAQGIRRRHAPRPASEHPPDGRHELGLLLGGAGRGRPRDVLRRPPVLPARAVPAVRTEKGVRRQAAGVPDQAEPGEVGDTAYRSDGG